MSVLFNLRELFAIRRENAELARSHTSRVDLEHEVTVAWNEFLDSTAVLCAAQEAMDAAHRKYIEANKRAEASRG